MGARNRQPAMLDAQPAPNGSPPLAVTWSGGPCCWQRDRVLFDLVEECGGRIVLDATETGRADAARAVRPPAARRRPAEELADAYFDAFPTPSAGPTAGSTSGSAASCAGRRIAGILLRRYVWCDLWHAELARLQGSGPVPVLRPRTATATASIAAVRRPQTAIEAFLETLHVNDTPRRITLARVGPALRASCAPRGLREPRLRRAAPPARRRRRLCAC